MNVASTIKPAATLPNRMVIGGRLVEARSGKTFNVENPATGEVIATVPDAHAADIDLAVRAARESFDQGAWWKLRYSDRAEILWRLADILQANAEELAHIETLDNGMKLADATAFVRGGIGSIRTFAGICGKLHGRTAEVSGPGMEFHAFSLREPVGVAALITPWNGPFTMACTKSAMALAAGCSVVLKPAEQTPLTALKLGEYALEAGIPAGVFNVVTGFGETAGAPLCAHPEVDKISFTGSTVVGKQIMKVAADRMKRVSFELGGKSPVFIFEDADLEQTIPAAAMGIFRNSGQVCFAGSRLYVHDKSYDRVVSGISEIAGKIRLGDGMDPATDLGPLISGKQQERVLGYVESGREAGAEVVTGGARLDGPGYFVKPTVVAGVNAEMQLVREEIFGPVLTVQPFKEIDDVAAIGNATRYGLGAGIYTRDLSRAHRLAKALRAGNVWVNNYGFLDRMLPFGGYKESGLGREGGYEGLGAFMEDKTVYMKL